MPGESHYHLATIYLNRKQYNKAITHYTASANLNYQTDYSIFNRGVAYLNLNKIEQAKNDFQKVEKITANPDLKKSAKDAVNKLSKINIQENVKTQENVKIQENVKQNIQQNVQQQTTLQQ